LKPYFESGGVTIYHADAGEILPTLADKSVDLVLSDPPYGANNNSGDLRGNVQGNASMQRLPKDFTLGFQSIPPDVRKRIETARRKPHKPIEPLDTGNPSGGITKTT